MTDCPGFTRLHPTVARMGSGDPTAPKRTQRVEKMNGSSGGEPLNWSNILDVFSTCRHWRRHVSKVKSLIGWPNWQPRQSSDFLLWPTATRRNLGSGLLKSCCRPGGTFKNTFYKVSYLASGVQSGPARHTGSGREVDSTFFCVFNVYLSPSATYNK